MAHAFSDAAIKEQEALIKQYVDKLYAHLRKDAAQHKPTDVLKWFNFTTFDIIGDLVFGEPFDCLDNSDYHPWVAMIFAGIRAGSQMVALLKLPLISWTLRFMISEADVQKRLQHKAMSRGKAERRIALGPAPNGRKDIMTYILRHNDERGMNHAEILGNSEALIAAGSETTATVLSGLVYYTGITPQALKRVQEEVRTAFSTEEEITMTSTAHLKYLHACIEEAMRLYPPAAETPPRVSPGGYVNGYYFPKGVSPALFLPHWSMNRNGLDLPSEIVQVEMIKD
jgi:cytochrome P450